MQNESNHLESAARRSDDKIREGVLEHLGWNPYVRSDDVRVRVDGGVVVMEGRVDSEEMKKMAEDAATSVAGVTRIENRLEVRRQNHAA